MSKEQVQKIVDLLRENDQEVSDELIEYVKSIGQYGWHEEINDEVKLDYSKYTS